MSAGVVLPDNVAKDLNAQRQAQAQVATLRINIAANIMGHLMQVQYAADLAEARTKAGVYGSNEDGEAEPVPFSVNLGQPARLAAQSADALLIALGILRVQEGES